MFLNRRRHARQAVAPGVYVDLGPENGGWLSNISEGGLELHLFGPEAVGQAVHLGFGLPGTENRIEVNCRITWVDKLGRKAGLEFQDLSEASRQQIREWHPVRVSKDEEAMPKYASRPTGMWVVLILLAISLVVLYPFMSRRLPALRSITPPETKANREVQVWAVKRTGLYYCPESKLYGKGESGVMMAQDKAVEGGYRPASGEACR